MSKVLITTVPFGEKSRLPLELLQKNNIDYTINPLNKKLTEDELVEMVSDYDVIIAGTESITKKVMSRATRLKMISRVGIGLDSVDLLEAEKLDIVVSYTPDAPAPAVAELTIGFMLTLLRSAQLSNIEMHKGKWNRFFGRRLSKVTIGIIGVGRIGRLVLQNLQGFGTLNILANDITPDISLNKNFNIKWVDKEEIYRLADVITIHTPLTLKTKNMIEKKHMLKMKSDAIVINTARGGIINEKDLYSVMQAGHLNGAAELQKIKRCILTAHMGSMSIDCRTRMELEATEEAIRFLTDQSLEGIVPKEEYDAQREGL